MYNKYGIPFGYIVDIAPYVHSIHILSRIAYKFPFSLFKKKSGKIRKTKIKKTLTSYLQTLPL